MKCTPAMEHKHPVILEQPKNNIKRDTQRLMLPDLNPNAEFLINFCLTTRLPIFCHQGGGC